jgi:hypothetical protein
MPVFGNRSKAKIYTQTRFSGIDYRLSNGEEIVVCTKSQSVVGNFIKFSKTSPLFHLNT